MLFKQSVLFIYSEIILFLYIAAMITNSCGKGAGVRLRVMSGFDAENIDPQGLPPASVNNLKLICTQIRVAIGNIVAETLLQKHLSCREYLETFL